MTVRLSRRSFLALVPPLGLVRSRRQVAVTMDDVNWAAIPEPFAESALARILEAVGSRKAARTATTKSRFSTI